MLPSSAACACSARRRSDVFSSSATAATTKPGVQKPHIRPSVSQNACCTGCSTVPGGRGRRRCGSACPAPRWRASSTSRPCGRRRSSCRRRRCRDRRRACCPVRSARLRIASSSVTRGSTFSSCVLPLTISSTGTSPGPTGAGPACASRSAGASTPGRNRSTAYCLQE